MAKKDFKSGLSSIIPNQDAVQETTPEPTVAKRRRTKPENIKHSLTLDKEQLEKLRIIASEERLSLKKVVYDSFKAYIKKYEKEYGEIEL